MKLNRIKNRIEYIYIYFLRKLEYYGTPKQNRNSSYLFYRNAITTPGDIDREIKDYKRKGMTCDRIEAYAKGKILMEMVSKGEKLTITFMKDGKICVKCNDELHSQIEKIKLTDEEIKMYAKMLKEEMMNK